ncbi:hypothetical protein [uncultured Chryseobacterium sp.]|uniref:hypothetical protein n=1 Tax=uncultured Chryseobacterium sp. TaxID=259322 RepID=UPI0025FB0311|nr:hypothetical protein [uncultured Chryseobacterium sp.]
MKKLIFVALTVFSLISCETEKKELESKNVVYLNADTWQEINSLGLAAILKQDGKLMMKDLRTGRVTRVDSTLFVGVDANGYIHYPDGRVVPGN